MRMRSLGLGFIAAAAAAGAYAAELPTMKPTPAKHYKACTIGGMSGFQIPGSDACVKLGGYVSGGVEAGNVKPGYNWASEPHN